MILFANAAPEPRCQCVVVNAHLGALTGSLTLLGVIVYLKLRNEHLWFDEHPTAACRYN